MQGQKTPLYDLHVQYHGNIVEFGGWLLPVQYTGIIEEHHAVRTRAGLFDVSHMGEIMVTGKEAAKFLQYLITNHLQGLFPGKVRYSPICYDNGGTVDDILIYMIAEEKYLLVVNASNVEKDYEWIRTQVKNFSCQVENISAQTAQLALQGPEAANILAPLTSFDLSTLKYYTFAPEVMVADCKVLLSRTGYTGEDGFEIYCTPHDAVILWEKIMAQGKSDGLLPCGLGARDTLRLEAGMPLYGHELSAEITPIEADLAKYVRTTPEPFLGQAVLTQQKAISPARKLIGVEMIERGIPRQGYRVWEKEQEIGWITSGTFSPTLNKNIGLAMLNKAYAEPGREVLVEIRGNKIKAMTVGKNFYQRGKKG